MLKVIFRVEILGEDDSRIFTREYSLNTLPINHFCDPQGPSISLANRNLGFYVKIKHEDFCSFPMEGGIQPFLIEVQHEPENFPGESIFDAQRRVGDLFLQKGWLEIDSN